MMPEIPKIAEEVKSAKTIPTASDVLPSGEMVEMVFRREERRTLFIVGEGDRWKEAESVTRSASERLVPFSASNNLLRHEVVLLPSRPEEYGSEAQLLADIRAFIHGYVDVSPLFEEIASYYVVFSWLYDAFNELPYLRVRGDFGTGKSRFLLIVGSLCYKPIFASGASTVSPIFRILDAFQGTLVIDEGDFRVSDERAEVVKILNNGNARGFPVLRSEQIGTKEFDPRAYAVFGPKIVATRGFFQDRALESRFLTEDMGETRLREDIPLNLPDSSKEEALRLRNKLLLFRLRTRGRRRELDLQPDRSIEPRLSQIFAPLLTVIDDPRARAALKDLARRYHRELVADRGMEMEAQILEVIRDLAANSAEPVSVKAIADLFIDRHGEDYDRKVTPKWIGSVIRRKLQLKPYKSHGVFVIAAEDQPRLDRLYEKFGLCESPRPRAAMSEGDVGEIGDEAGGASAS